MTNENQVVEDSLAAHPEQPGISNNAPASAEIWRMHCLRAVSKFLKNVVIVDNEPYTPPLRVGPQDYVLEVPLSADEGMGQPEKAALAVSPETSDFSENENNPVADLSAHRLDIVNVSDAFADEGLSCAFVLPNNDDTDSAAKKTRALKAAKVADVLIIDWQLENGSSALTREILQQLATQDKDEGGRLRLICIYTGMPNTEGLLDDAAVCLAKGGIVLGQEGNGYKKNEYCLLAVLNKNEVSAKELPGKIFNLFVELSAGLVSSFALASVGAIRKNTHHLLTRFGQSLDSAYVANRLITNPPEDTAELMRELLTYELDNTIGTESVADDYLAQEPIKSWLDQLSHNFEVHESISKEKILRLLEHGITDKGIPKGNGEEDKFSEDKRHYVSLALAGTIEASQAAERDFAILVSLKREGFGSRKAITPDGWLPSLTTGTILGGKSDAGDDIYYICLTPACDTLRLSNESAFLFVEAKITTDYGDVIIHDQNNNKVLISINQKRPVIRTMFFSPDPVLKRVRGSRVGNSSKITFKSSQAGQIEMVWMGEMRYGKTTSEIAKIAGVLMRIGLIDSEYLRLISSRKIKFSN